MWDVDAEVSLTERGDGLPRVLYLGKLAVTPRLRRRGLARALLASVDAMARDRGCVAVRFEAAGAVPELRELYERCGYTMRGSAPVSDATGAVLEFTLYEKRLN
jgi:GNAT superfamily N-acetyltransferase